MESKKKLIRITTVPMSLLFLLPGQMKYMSENGFDVLMISADGKEKDAAIANQNCRHLIVPMTRKITPFQDAKCIWQLVQIFKKEKPDIVHTHTPKAGLLGMIAAKISGVKVRIHTVAGLPLMATTGIKLNVLKIVEKITYSAATNVWPNSFSLLKYIKENNFTKEKKLQVISKGSSNGIDLNRYDKNLLDATKVEEIKTQINYDENNIYLISVGRLVKDKGIAEIVNVFKTLSIQNTKLKLLLLGSFENDLDPLPNNIVEEIKNNKNITAVGWSEAVEYYLSFANFFIFASHREGFPNVLLQSGAMGVPIICSKIEGNVDVVEDNKTGLLFDVTNEAQLKQKLDFALHNKEMMNQMANNLKIKINAHFERNKMWEAILKEYNNLLN